MEKINDKPHFLTDSALICGKMIKLSWKYKVALYNEKNTLKIDLRIYNENMDLQTGQSYA